MLFVLTCGILVEVSTWNYYFNSFPTIVLLKVSDGFCF